MYHSISAGIEAAGARTTGHARIRRYSQRVGVRSDDPNTRPRCPLSARRDPEPDQVNDLTEYVVALSHRPADAAAVARAAPVFQANCAVCHGPEAWATRRSARRT